MGELATEAGLPPGVLNIVHGYGKDAGEPLCAHPDVRAISFTGSTATGNRIVQSAGLKKFSMELGGKSPFVVFDDADLDRALDAAIFMIFSQQRRALHRRLAHPGAEVDLRRVRASASPSARSASSVGDPMDEKTIVGPMISQAHLAKVRSYIELGPKEGATLLARRARRAGAARRDEEGQLRAARPCSPTSTTACASRRKRSSARSPA